MEFETFEYEVLILEKHLDSFGHVNNAVYLELYEEARWDFITKKGYGLKKIHEEKKGPVLLDTTLKFKREILNRETIIIKTSEQWVRGKIMGLTQKMINKNDEVCSEATFTIGFMDMKLRKLVQPTKEWLHACGLV